MRRIKLVHLIGIILVIIAIVVIANKIFKNNEDEHKLLKIYNDLNSSQAYSFEMEQSNDNKTIMAKKEDKTLIDQYSEDSHSTTLIKDNNTYLILHDREEYYVYENNNIEQNILTDGLKTVVDKVFITDSEKVKGKKYSYEEYSGSTMFMVSSSLDVNEADIKTRFYFDKNDNLVYIKTIYGGKQELLKINLQKEAEDKLFEIPSHYAEN